MNRHKKYEAKRVKKTVSFNADKDKELLDFVNSIDFSNWVKEQIKKVQH